MSAHFSDDYDQPDPRDGESYREWYARTHNQPDPFRPMMDLVAEELARIDAINFRVTLEEELRKAFGPNAYECCEAHNIRLAGRIPDWSKDWR